MLTNYLRTCHTLCDVFMLCLPTLSAIVLEERVWHMRYIVCLRKKCKLMSDKLQSSWNNSGGFLWLVWINLPQTFRAANGGSLIASLKNEYLDLNWCQKLAYEWKFSPWSPSPSSSFTRLCYEMRYDIYKIIKTKQTLNLIRGRGRMSK